MMKSKNRFILRACLLGTTLSILLHMACKQPVSFEAIGSYEFLGAFTMTINGVPTSKEDFRIFRTMNQLRTLCSDTVMLPPDFLANCIKLDGWSEETISRLIEEYDVIASTVPIRQLLKNTEYTRKDQCGYLETQVLEVKLEDEIKKANQIFLYKVEPKGRYRFMLCP